MRRATLDRPECGSEGGNLHYNTPLHFIALLIILLLSTLACGFPLAARRFPRLPVPHRFLFLSRHFGTGVLIATAFVHLLPTAFVSLTDPCLPPFWNQGYPAMAGFIALMSVLAVVGVEMFFATRGAGHSHASEYGMIEQDGAKSTVDIPTPNGHARTMAGERRSLRYSRRRGSGAFYDVSSLKRTYGADEDVQGLSSVAKSQEEFVASAATYSDDGRESEEGSPSGPGGSTARLNERSPRPSQEEVDYSAPRRSGEEEVTPQTQSDDEKALLQCLLLEAGILFHSVFIGMALSVATGTSFIVLLVAISFHQTFEGFALGSRIAAITSFGARSAKPWLMVLAYGTTTPIGQAIGLGVHNLYDPESEMGLIMVGVFNSMSSGLLVFAGLVELLAVDFLSDESYQTLRGRKRVEACVAVVAGALLMALVGAWA